MAFIMTNIQQFQQFIFIAWWWKTSSNVYNLLLFFLGSFCSDHGLSAVSGPCLAGYFCTSGAKTNAPTDGSTGNICPAGKYCPLGTSVPQLCPPGTYSNQTGNKAVGYCTQCEQGQYCGGWGLEKPSGPCDTGYYCPGGQNTSHPEAYRYLWLLKDFWSFFSISIFSTGN